MARARGIKPGFYKNEDLAECSVWARYIFPGLWMLADREGRLEDRPKRIKAELLPFDTQDVEPLLRELATKCDDKGVPFIIRYQNSGGRFIQISKFKEHQNPHYSEKESVIKPPEIREYTGDDGGNTPGNDQSGRGGRNPPCTDSLTPSSLTPSSPTPDSGVKRTRAKRATHKTPIPEGFQVSERVRQWAEGKGFTQIEQHCEVFLSKCRAKNYTYADWDEGLMGAIREDWAGLRDGHSVEDKNRQAMETWLKGEA